MSKLTSILLPLSAAAAALGSCPSSDWLPFTDGACYLPLVPPLPKMDADEAVQTCRFFGPDVALPQVYSYADQKRVHLLTGGNPSWLDLRRANLSSPWLWPGGQPATYTHWAGNEPSKTEENCVAMNSDGFWFNLRCDYTSYFAICYRPEPREL